MLNIFSYIRNKKKINIMLNKTKHKYKCNGEKIIRGGKEKNYENYIIDKKKGNSISTSSNSTSSNSPPKNLPPKNSPSSNSPPKNLPPKNSHLSNSHSSNSPSRDSPSRISPSRVSPSRVSPSRISPSRVSPPNFLDNKIREYCQSITPNQIKDIYNTLLANGLNLKKGGKNTPTKRYKKK